MDVYRADAATVFGDASKVQDTPRTAKQHPIISQSGEDVLPFAIARFPVATPKADILPVEGQNFGLANGWQVALIKQACKY